MRGGCGLYKEYTVNTDLNLSLWFERSKTTGWGLFNGKDGIGPNVNIKHSSGKEENRLKSNSYPIKKGTVVTTYTGGGGGFGDSYDRDPKNVLEDVINGLVSIDKAEKDYKVIISRNMSIDYSKTNDLRSKK